MIHLLLRRQGRLRFVASFATCFLLLLLACGTTAFGAFGLTTTSTYYQVDCGSTPSLVFRIRGTGATDTSTTSPGDIMSLKYNGIEYQDQSRGSQINSGFDFTMSDSDTVSVAAVVVNTDYVKVTVTVTAATGGVLTHYYIAHKGEPRIYMATHFTQEPQLGLCRYILRLPSTNLDYPYNVYNRSPRPSDIRNNTGAIESSDVFGMSDGTTRSKHYSGMRLTDWNYIGATNTQTSPTVGAWMVRDNTEGGSGGPFYRSLINQCGSDQEITYIVNYGEGQTEAFRPGILNGYTLVFTDGAEPGSVDTSFFANMGLTGYIAPAARGTVSGAGITGRDTNFDYTVGLSNTTAQYSGPADASTGAFTIDGVIPGSYTLTVYKNELSVYTTTVTVTAGTTTSLASIALTADPARTIPIFRIGSWDGTPNEFLHADKVTWMHPSDTRITGASGTAAWAPGTYTVGTSTPATGFPCYQWKSVNGTQSVQFTLTASQIVSSTVRIGITTGFAGGRPNISVNSWSNTNLPSASTQPDSRTLTVGTYRGNNKTFSFTVPASALVVGTNTLNISVISGSSGTTYLSPGYATDCVEFTQTSSTLNVPAAPADLSGTATPSTHTINLTWSAVSGAAIYNVYRSASASGPFTKIASALTATNYADSSNTDPATYYYRVNAENTSGAGLPSSATVSLTPIAVTWTGSTSGTWDTMTANWKTSDTGVATTYADGDTATFDDSSSITSVTLSATFTPFATIVSSAANYTFSGAGAIAGTGKLTKSGTGNLTISTAQTFTGGSTITAGTITLGNAAALGSGTITLSGGTLGTGSLTPTNAIDVTANSKITGGNGGGLQGIKNVSGTGTLTLEATNVFDLEGALANFTGTVLLSGTGSFRFYSNGGGGAAADWDLGTRNLSARNGIAYALGSLSGNSTAVLQGSSGTGNVLAVTYTVGANGHNSTFAGSIKNGGGATSLTKTGTGTLTLSGANTYTGTTTVSAGSLHVTGSLAATAVSVATDSMIGGTGSLGGNLTLASGARLGLGVDASTTNGLTVAGTATLNGNITVVPVFLGGTLAPGTYTLLTYTGALGGSPNFTWSDDSGSGYTATFDTSVSGVVKITLGGIAPMAPTGLTATAGIGQVSLLWSGVSGATSYSVLRSMTSGSGYATIASNLTSTSYTDTSVTNGTTYYYVLTAKNGADTSTASFEASATPYSAQQNWRQAYFATTTNTGDAADNADPDADGIVNLLEYALATDPTTPSAAAYTLQFSNGVLQLTFNRVADASLTYTVQGSTDLTTWADLWSSTGSANLAGPVTVSDTDASSTTSRFLCLKVITSGP